MSAVWFNGQLVEGELALDPRDRGLLLGDGVFETIAVFNGHPVWLDEHVARMQKAASVLGLNIKSGMISDAIQEISDGQSGVLRITVTRGPMARGLGSMGETQCNLMVSFSAWTKGTLFAPVRLITSSVRRNPYSISSQHKTLSYVDNIFAAREASVQSADDALMLNTHGRIACSTIANICILEGNTLTTPLDSTEGVLQGITIAKTFGHPARELNLAPSGSHIEADRVYKADGVFLTNSLRLIRPVTELDGRPLSQVGAPTIDRLFDLLCRQIEKEAGVDPRTVDTV